MYYEGLREADMMVGIDPYSLVKYFNEAQWRGVFSAGSASEYIHSFAGTVVEYLRDAPNVLHLREDPRVDDVNTKVGFLFTVMHATETLGVDGFEKLASEVCAELSSSEDKEVMEGIFRRALDLHRSFEDYKTLVFGEGGEAERFGAQAKEDLSRRFANMVRDIMGFEYQKLKALSFNNEVMVHMKELEDRFTKN